METGVQASLGIMWAQFKGHQKNHKISQHICYQGVLPRHMRFSKSCGTNLMATKKPPKYHSKYFIEGLYRETSVDVSSCSLTSILAGVYQATFGCDIVGEFEFLR